MESKFKWDGESIKQIRVEEEKKHTPKEILNALQNVRNQIHQMKQSKVQLDQQLKQVESNLKSAGEHEKDLRVNFEEKCIKLQVEKLKFLVGTISEECKKKALESSAATIAKDPSAYTDEQKKNLSYLDYQKLLATNEKVAEKISSGIITKHLYDEPFFANPYN